MLIESSECIEDAEALIGLSECIQSSRLERVFDDIFRISHRNLCCDSSYELSHQDSSYEGSQHVSVQNKQKLSLIITKYSLISRTLVLAGLSFCCFWPGLGLPRPKAIVVIPKNQPLPKHLRK